MLRVRSLHSERPSRLVSCLLSPKSFNLCLIRVYSLSLHLYHPMLQCMSPNWYFYNRPAHKNYNRCSPWKHDSPTPLADESSPTNGTLPAFLQVPVLECSLSIHLPFTSYSVVHSTFRRCTGLSQLVSVSSYLHGLLSGLLCCVNPSNIWRLEILRVLWCVSDLLVLHLAFWTDENNTNTLDPTMRTMSMRSRGSRH